METLGKFTASRECPTREISHFNICRTFLAMEFLFQNINGEIYFQESIHFSSFRDGSGRRPEQVLMKHEGSRQKLRRSFVESYFECTKGGADGFRHRSNSAREGKLEAIPTDKPNPRLFCTLLGGKSDFTKAGFSPI